MSDAPAEMYLDLLKQVLTRSLFVEEEVREPHPVGWMASVYGPVRRAMGRVGYRLVKVVRESERREGHDWPAAADTMVGLHRLDNFHDCIRTVLEDGVPGDIIETGVWRGGACIFARGALRAYGDTVRKVWVADSFQGLPRPDQAHPVDAGDRHWRHPVLAVSLDEVKSRFHRYGLLDEQVEFVVGWFSETLHAVPAARFSIIRLDGDMYGSTMDALEALYDRVSPNGFVIVDDYALPRCRQAVDDFRRARDITEPITAVDWTGVFWRKAG